MTRPNIFGANIAAVVNRALARHLLAGTLTRTTPGTRDASALTEGQTVGATTESWDIRGFVDDFQGAKVQGNNAGGPAVYGSLVSTGYRNITILGGSLPDSIDPKTGDVVTIEGQDWHILEVSRDPVGATFECVGRL